MNLHDKGSKERPIPNLFIVGAAKAGTTALVKILEQHPKIFISPIKEPNFFNSEIDASQLHPSVSKDVLVSDSYFNRRPLIEKHLALIQNEESYLKLFNTNGDFNYFCEASTGYLYSPVAAGNIYKFNPKAKIIIILRDPVKRTLSHFQMDVARGIQQAVNAHDIIRKDFENQDKGYLKTHLYIDLSLYYEQIKRYYSIFPSDQIVVLRQEELAIQPEKVLATLSTFLDIDCKDLNASILANETRIPRFSWMRRMKSFKRFAPRAFVRWIKKKGFLFTRPDSDNKSELAVKTYLDSVINEDWIKTQAFIKDIQQHKPTN